MPYCVHCGVELDEAASFCPLCHTPVVDPSARCRAPGQPEEPPFFPTRRAEVTPVSKQELALLVTAMLACVAVCCGVLNLFLKPERAWSLQAVLEPILLG